MRRDETEKGERMKLNFGHTVGHALEKLKGMPHGQAVAVGMLAEAKMAAFMGKVGGDGAERLKDVLDCLGLPTRMPKVDSAALYEAIARDKKKRGGTMMMPVLDGLGGCRIINVKLVKIREALDDLRQHR